MRFKLFGGLGRDSFTPSRELVVVTDESSNCELGSERQGLVLGDGLAVFGAVHGKSWGVLEGLT